MFAHQDDECLISSRLQREVGSGRVVHCVYLTDGSSRRNRPDVRDAESRGVLRSLGVPAANVHFLGSRHGISDLSLKDHLDEALGLTDSAFAGRVVHRIFCPAWEGGHPDHDAAHLIALAFAARRGRLARTWQFPAYHGRGLPSPLYRVAAPLDRPGRSLRRRLALAEGLRGGWLPWRYPSQRRTMLLIFPELFARRALMRHEVLQSVDSRVTACRPHPGTLLYERRYGCSWADFQRAAHPFMMRLGPIGDGAEPSGSVP